MTLPTPSRIIVYDEYEQPWEIDSQDALWQDALILSNHGQGRAIIPLATIVAKRGWGWWSAFKKQDEWLRECQIPVPDHNMLKGAAGGSPAGLAPLLQQYGGYVSWLEAQVGLLEGRRVALKQAYESAVMVRSTELKGHEKLAEKAKESQVLAHSETIRQTRRLLIETEAILATAKGMMDGYQRAWETVSRILTARTAEAEGAGTRRAP